MRGLFLSVFLASIAHLAPGAPPHVLILLGDDWSWPHAGAYGPNPVRTPTFNRIAREGARFDLAFANAPSCTPSRHALVTGQYPWRLEEGVNLGGSLPELVATFPELLAEAGYRTGFARKGIAPSKHLHRDGKDPLGPRFKSFESFLAEQSEAQPFCFWYGAGEPHRPYPFGESRRSKSVDRSLIEVPAFLANDEIVRTDLADYHLRVRQLDQFAGNILGHLEEEGLLDDTLVIMAGDNGMPFPLCKATLRDGGTRVPLAIRWPERIRAGVVVNDLVTLADLAPTILDACQVEPTKVMTGQSLWPVLQEETNRKPREAVVMGMEKHVYPAPSRAIRTHDHLYIRNLAPTAWLTGADSETLARRFDFLDTPWPRQPGAFSFNIDPSPTKQWLRHHRPDHSAFATRAHEELYHLPSDPNQRSNLAADPEYDELRNRLRNQLHDELRATGDPRFKSPRHTTLTIHGWTIHLADSLLTSAPAKTREALDIMSKQLGNIVEVMPAKALAEIRKVPIWINPQYPGFPGRAEYHPGAEWLRNNGRDPAMVRSVEVTKIDNFAFENVRMPWLMLHELAHGYHHRVLGHDYAPINEAYAAAAESGKYETVKRWTGRLHRNDRAYAITNPKEYFAEATEAYFGTNDFYPFNRAQLAEHDPKMLKVVGKAWGVQ